MNIQAKEYSILAKKWTIQMDSDSLEFSKDGSDTHITVPQNQAINCLRFRTDNNGYHVTVKQAGKKVALTLQPSDIQILQDWLPKEVVQQVSSKSLLAWIQEKWAIFIGIFSIIAGLSGHFVLIGTNSSVALVVVGIGLLIWGIVKETKKQ